MTDTPRCDGCSRPTEYTLTAAYDYDRSAVHPLVACYPAPMIRACGPHLLQLLEIDRNAPGATSHYLLTAVDAAAGVSVLSQDAEAE